MNKPIRVGDLSTRKLSDDETVALSPSGSAVILNEVGAVVLDLCDGTRSVDDIASVVCSAFAGAEEDRVHADVRAFVSQLSDAGCVVEAS